MKQVVRFLSYFAPTYFLRDSRTVHYAFSFIFILAAILGMASLTPQAGSYVILSAAQTSVETGSVVPIDVYVYAHTPVNAVDISVSIPQEQVTIIGIDKGQTVLTLWTEEPSYANGVVTLRGGTFKKGFVGKHKIATIQAKTLKPGSVEFLAKEATLLAGDGTGSEVDMSSGQSIIMAIHEPGAESVEAHAVMVLASDIDHDGVITMKDVQAFMVEWWRKDRVLDFNADGRMSIHDFSILLANYFTAS